MKKNPTRIKIAILQFLLVISIISCAGDGKGYSITNDEVVFSPIEAEVRLSKTAERLIKDKKETLRLFGAIMANPKMEIDKKYGNYVNQDEEFDFYNAFDYEIDYPGRFIIDDLKIPKDLFACLDEESLNVFMNFVTGRKSSGDNLIVPWSRAVKIENIMGKKYKAESMLIEEEL